MHLSVKSAAKFSTRTKKSCSDTLAARILASLSKNSIWTKAYLERHLNNLFTVHPSYGLRSSLRAASRAWCLISAHLSMSVVSCHEVEWINSAPTMRSRLIPYLDVLSEWATSPSTATTLIANWRLAVCQEQWISMGGANRRARLRCQDHFYQIRKRG